MQTTSNLAFTLLLAFAPATSALAQTFQCVDGEDFETYPFDTAQISPFFGKPGDTVEMALLWKTDSAMLGFEATIRYPFEALTPVMYPESAFANGRTPIDIVLAGRARTHDDGSMTSRLRAFSYQINDSNLISVRWIQSIAGDEIIPGGIGQIARVRFVVNDSVPQGVLLPLVIEHFPVVALIDSIFVQFGCTIANSAQNWRTDSVVQLPGLFAPVLVAGSFTTDCCIVPGDADRDGTASIADVTFLIARIFDRGPAPICIDEADANGNNKVNIADITYLITMIFAGGPAPVCGSTDT